jgi:hypothetical protein
VRLTKDWRTGFGSCWPDLSFWRWDGKNASSGWIFPFVKPFFTDSLAPGCGIAEIIRLQERKNGGRRVAEQIFGGTGGMATARSHGCAAGGFGSLVRGVFVHGVLKPASGVDGRQRRWAGPRRLPPAFVLAVRRDLRGTTLAVAASIMLGWISTLPSVVEQGFDLPGDGKVAPVIFVMSPLIAIAAATLAWCDVYPIAAALIASAMTFVGILFVIAFGILIAMYGF